MLHVSSELLTKRDRQSQTKQRHKAHVTCTWQEDKSYVVRCTGVYCNLARDRRAKMRGDLSKLFAFLGSKPSNQKKRQRSSSIACPREISRSHRTSLPVGIKEVPRDSQQILFPNKTIPKRRKPQLVKGGRSLSLPGVVTGQEDKRCTLATPSNRLGHPQRKRLAENVDIHHYFTEEDFEIEEAQEIWRLLKDRSIYSETSVQGGLLTTTLCSTEL